MTMTPEEALGWGAAYVEQMHKGVIKGGTAVERAAVGLAVASFIMEWGEVGDAEARDTDEDDAPLVALGPVRKVLSTDSPGDYAYVRAGKTGRTPVVVVQINADGDDSHVLLSPRDARAYAAGILDAADEADGTTPLVLMAPDGPLA